MVRVHGDLIGHLPNDMTGPFPETQDYCFQLFHNSGHSMFSLHLSDGSKDFIYLFFLQCRILIRKFNPRCLRASFTDEFNIVSFKTDGVFLC